MKPESQWRCKNCEKVFYINDLLKAASPFDPDETLVGCPQCKQCADGFDRLCDEYFVPILYSGYSVYCELDEAAKSRTSHENVSDTLDAVARLRRKELLREASKKTACNPGKTDR